MHSATEPATLAVGATAHDGRARALNAIAAVMNGLKPDRNTAAAVAGTRVDAALVHRATALALRHQLASLPAAGDRHRGGSPRNPGLLERAHELAVLLVHRCGGRVAPEPLSGVWLATPSDIDAAALLGVMQLRFLESVCSQIVIQAHPLTVTTEAGDTARTVLVKGGHLGPGVTLLDDYTGVDRRDGLGPWLHALSPITVAGRVENAVVDAGPDRLSARSTARMASPVTVTAAPGLWSEAVVEDCLALCASGVRRWVASMPRTLSEIGDGDLEFRQVSPLRNHLISPATAELTDYRAAPPPTLPLIPATHPLGKSPKETSNMMSRLRLGGVIGKELAADTRLRTDVHVGELLPDTLALLAVAPASELGREVTVTVNLEVPEWQNLSEVIARVRHLGGLTLTDAVVGRADSDIVAGARRRVSLRVVVRAGVVCATRRGCVVVLPAGTRITLIGADASRGHTALYGVQVRPVAGDSAA